MVLHIDKRYSENPKEFVDVLMKKPDWKLGMFDQHELWDLMLASYESPFQQSSEPGKSRKSNYRERK